MLKKLRTDFLNGISRIRWFSGVLSERLNIEIAIFKLLFKSDEIERKKDELLTTIGGRVYELREATDRNLLKDRVIGESIAEIEQLEKEMVELGKRIEELSRVGT